MIADSTIKDRLHVFLFSSEKLEKHKHLKLVYIYIYIIIYNYLYIYIYSTPPFKIHPTAMLFH